MDFHELQEKHGTGVLIGLTVAAGVYFWFGHQPDQARQYQQTQQQQPAQTYGEGFAEAVPRRPHVVPWHPGLPRNPQQCAARGGIDMGRWCKWH
jgi:hypothetical protein